MNTGLHGVCEVPVNDVEARVWCVVFFNWFFYTDSIYSVYKDKLQNCSCNQFHYIGTYKQVESSSMTKNRVGNNGSEKWVEKNTAARCVVRGLRTSGSFCVCVWKNNFKCRVRLFCQIFLIN